MEQNTAILLQNLAQKYETKDFIAKDPVSFPHLFKETKDIEIAAFVAQWLAYGKRELFLKVLQQIGEEMNFSPYTYIHNRGFERFDGDNTCLYRFYKKKDFYLLCDSLYNIYFNIGKGEKTMQDVLKQRLQKEKTDDCLLLLAEIEAIFKQINGIPQDTKSACKRLCMFLRWMVRKNSAVDFGLWDVIDTKDLIIPLDVHVFRQSKQLNLTDRNDATMKTALQITNNLKKVFPFDPVKADFALFGIGIDNQKI